MTLVMDGVRGGGVVRARSQRRTGTASQKSKPTADATELRLSVGMDGLRRPVGAVRTAEPERAERAVVVAPAVVQPAAEPIAAPRQAPVPATAAVRPAQVIPEMPVFIEPVPARTMAGWRKPALATAFAVTTLLVSVVAVRAVSAPKSTTVHAEAVAPHASAATVDEHKVGLQQLLTTFGATGGSTFSVVVKDLKTGETGSLNPDQQMESASIYKLFVAQRIYQRIDLGQLKYTDQAGGDSGDTVGECLTVMINISDNTCGRALGGILNWGDQDQALDAEGYTTTDLATPQQTSATDVAKLMERLYLGTLLSPDSTNRFMSLLKDQRVNNRLPTGLPARTVIAHKTGDLDNFVHDAGIVYGPKTDYLVVVLSGPWSSPTVAPAAFTSLSQQLWNHFEQ